jgi:hypothetical protein
MVEASTAAVRTQGCWRLVQLDLPPTARTNNSSQGRALGLIIGYNLRACPAAAESDLDPAGRLRTTMARRFTFA